MRPEHSYESLDDIWPFKTHLGELQKRFETAPHAVDRGPTVSALADLKNRFGDPIEGSEGQLCFQFPTRGLNVFISADERTAADPVICEVRVFEPSVHQLPCGIWIGQPQAEAIELVRESYEVHDEYDDAIYFWPSTRRDLVASVEFFESGTVVSFELFEPDPAWVTSSPAKTSPAP